MRMPPLGNSNTTQVSMSMAFGLQQWLSSQMDQSQPNDTQFPSGFNAFNSLSADTLTLSSPLWLSPNPSPTPDGNLPGQAPLSANVQADPFASGNTSLTAASSGSNGMNGLATVMQLLMQFTGSLPALLEQKQQQDALTQKKAALEAKLTKLKRENLELRLQKLKKENKTLKTQIKELRERRERMAHQPPPPPPPPPPVPTVSIPNTSTGNTGTHNPVVIPPPPPPPPPPPVVVSVDNVNQSDFDTQFNGFANFINYVSGSGNYILRSSLQAAIDREPADSNKRAVMQNVMNHYTDIVRNQTNKNPNGPINVELLDKWYN